MVERSTFNILPVEPQIDHTFRVYDFFGSVVEVDIPFSEAAAYPQYNMPHLESLSSQPNQTSNIYGPRRTPN